MNKKKIIVTGAEGLIGKSVCDLLVDEYQIIKVVRKSKNEQSAETVFEIDITDDKNFDQIKDIEEVFAIVHCAGLAHAFDLAKSKDFFRVNTLGTENVAKLAKHLNVKKFILISSVSVYGQDTERKPGIPTVENCICDPQTPYAQSKYEAEKKLQAITFDTNIKTIIIRLATVIGEGDVGNVRRLITHIDQGKFFWIGKGQNLKSLIYKDDVAAAVKEILKKEHIKSVVYNLSGGLISTKDIVLSIAKKLNVSILPINLPAGLTVTTIQFLYVLTKSKRLKELNKTLVKWISEANFSSNKFNQEFNFKPQTSITEALEREVVWYQRHK